MPLPSWRIVAVLASTIACGGGSPSGAGVSPTGPYVSADCPDGQYQEVLPLLDASVSDLTFSDAEQYTTDALDRRYPAGAFLVRGGLEDQTFGNCVQTFSGGATTVDGVLNTLSTVVHECGHFHDLAVSSGPDTVFALTEATSRTCPDAPATMARSAIKSDAYGALRPPCAETSSEPCDVYADIYLAGDPNDATFDAGDLGLEFLLEELVQYTHTLAVAWAYQSELSSAPEGAREGLLVHLWYLERYLRHARTEDPATYAVASGACWNEAILTMWGRAWLYLEASEQESGLGAGDTSLSDLVADPDLLAEIEALRVAHGCGGG